MSRHKMRYAILGTVGITAGITACSTPGNGTLVATQVVSTPFHTVPTPVASNLAPYPTQSPTVGSVPAVAVSPVQPYKSMCQLVNGDGGWNGIEPQVTITANQSLVIDYYGVQYLNSAGIVIGSDGTLVPSIPNVSAGQIAEITPGGAYTTNPPSDATGCLLDPNMSSISESGEQ